MPAGGRHIPQALREIIKLVFNASRSLVSLAFVLSLAPTGCRGQSAAVVPTRSVSSSTLSPELTRRIEVLIRSRSNVPPNYTIQIGQQTASDVPGFR